MAEKGDIMKIILIVAFVIIIIVTLLSIITTNKAYAYKHNVDSPNKSPYKPKNDNDNNKD